jgi:hypothetical protein
MAIERNRVIPARRTRIPSVAVFLLALAVLMILGIAPWIDPLLAPGLMLLGCGLIGMAMILALRIVWPPSPKTGRGSDA